MTAPAWAAPGARLFLVAYDGGDGKPYALAVSNLDVAPALARKLRGEVIDTAIDQHTDMAIGGEKQTYTTEVTWRVPEYVHLTVEAETPEEATEKALTEVANHPDSYERTLDYETCGPDVVTGIWEGDEAYPQVCSQPIPLPPTPATLLELAIEGVLSRHSDARSIEALRDAFAKWKEDR